MARIKSNRDLRFEAANRREKRKSRTNFASISTLYSGIAINIGALACSLLYDDSHNPHPQIKEQASEISNRIISINSQEDTLVHKLRYNHRITEEQKREYSQIESKLEDLNSQRLDLSREIKDLYATPEGIESSEFSMQVLKDAVPYFAIGTTLMLASFPILIVGKKRANRIYQREIEQIGDGE